MAFQSSSEGAEPIRESVTAGAQHERRATLGRLASGTLACPHCDAPVALGPQAVSPADTLDCPYCRHLGRVRDFLSLSQPTRPTRVAVRVVLS